MGPDDDDEGVQPVRDYRRDEGNRVIAITILHVPKSEEYTQGWKYRLHYGEKNGEVLLRYDNSHDRHERHPPEDGEEINFPGMEELYRRFRNEIHEL